jgi:hypothetical protein
MASHLAQFTIQPAPSSDHPAPTFVSLEAIHDNPFFYLTFLPGVSPEKISQYHFETKIKPPDDDSVEIMKVVDIPCLPVPKIVRFASWRVSQGEKEKRKQELPQGADPRFLEQFWEKARSIAEEHCNPDTDIGI